MTNETEKLIEEAQWYARRIGDYDGVPTELEDVLDGVVAALRLSQAERDAALKQAAAWEIQAQDLRDRLVRAEAERDAQHDLVLRLTAERDEAKADAVRMLTAASQPGITSARLAADLDEARAQVWGLICVATNCAIKADKGFPALRQVLDQRDELTATRDLLIDENARLQKEHNAYVQRLSADALQVASKYQRERDAAQSMEADTARRSSAEIDGLKAELNEARGEIEDLNRRVAELHGQREEARKERDVLQWVKTASVRLLDALSRIQWMEPHEPEDEKAAKAVRDWLSVSGLLVHAELLEDIKDLRAQIATLELLRRGGK